MAISWKTYSNHYTYRQTSSLTQSSVTVGRPCRACRHMQYGDYVLDLLSMRRRSIKPHDATSSRLHDLLEPEEPHKTNTHWITAMTTVIGR
eukprot:scaffold42763_cov46-Prasinocladus_malaysianus.AAC.1